MDIGGFVGTYCVPLAQFYKHTYVFEPHVRNKEILDENIKINALNNVTSVPVGLGSDNCYLNLVRDARSGSVFIKSQVKVPDGIIVRRLDDFLKEQDIDLSSVALIKLDAECSEDEILLGAVETIAASRPIIYLETHNGPYRYESSTEAKKIMEEYAYDKVKDYSDWNALWLPRNVKP